MLTLETANAVIEYTLGAAREKNAKPLTVVVLDGGGYIIACQRQDRCSLFRFDIARAKAMGALGMGADTRAISEWAANLPTFFTTVAVVSQGNLALSPGGVIIRGADGEPIGAMGVSGDVGDIDEECAIAGLTAAGLIRGAGK